MSQTLELKKSIQGSNPEENDKTPTEILFFRQNIFNLDQHMTVPLRDNKYYRRIVMECKIKDKRIKFLENGIHYVLRDYNQIIDKKGDDIDKLEFLKFVSTLTNEHQYATSLATKGLFLQEAYLYLKMNIRILLTMKDNKPLPEHITFSNEECVLTSLDQETIDMMMVWAEILYNFFYNPTIVDYAVSAKYNFFEPIFAYISGSSSINQQNPNIAGTNILIMYQYTLSILQKLGSTVIQLRTKFIQILEVMLCYEKYCDILLENPHLENWIYNFLSKATDYEEYMTLYKSLLHIAKNQNFDISVKSKMFINENIFHVMEIIIYPHLRNQMENIRYQQPDNIKKTCRIISEMLFALTDKQNFIEEVSKLIRYNKKDILMRFLLEVTIRKDVYSTSYMSLAIMNMIKTNKYQLPNFSARIMNMMIKSCLGNNDMLFLSISRFVKYIDFSRGEKSELFTILLTLSQNYEIALNLEEFDKTLQKYQEVYFANRLDKAIVRMKQDQNSIIKLDLDKYREDNNINDFANTNIIFSDDTDKEEEDFPHKYTIKNKIKIEKTNEKKNIKEKKSSEVLFNFQGDQKKLDMATYLHNDEYQLNPKKDLNEDFIFIKHGEGICQYCTSLQGFFSAKNIDYEKYMIQELEKNAEYFEYNQTDVTLAIFQIVYDLTFDVDLDLIKQDIYPHFCRYLTTETIHLKYKIPVLLYFTHIVNYYAQSIDLFYIHCFFVFSEDFLIDFLNYFDLESYKTKMKKPRNKTMKVLKQKTEVVSPPTNKNKNKKKNDKVNQEPVYEDIEYFETDVVIWNEQTLVFEYAPREFDQTRVNMIQNEAEDDISDDGKLTKYFWKLHFLYHLVKLLFEIAKRLAPHQNIYLQKQFENFILNIIEACIIFSKYNDKLIPTAPFHEDTECWSENKFLMIESVGVFLELFFQLILRVPKFNDQLANIFEENPNYLCEFLYMFGKLPTLPSSVALSSSILLFVEGQILNNENKLSIEVNIGEIYIEYISKEFMRIKNGSKNIIENNENDMESTTIFNIKAVCNIFKLFAISMNTINIFLKKKMIELSSINIDAINNIFSPLIQILKLAQIIKKKIVYISFEAENDDNNAETKSTRFRSTKKSEEIEKLTKIYQNFLSAFPIFLWSASEDKSVNNVILDFILYSQIITTQKIILKNGIGSYILDLFHDLDFPNEGYFALMSMYENICKSHQMLRKIKPIDDKFESSLLNFLKRTRPTQYKSILPILRGLRILLFNDISDSEKFRELIPNIIIVMESLYDKKDDNIFDTDISEISEEVPTALNRAAANISVMDFAEVLGIKMDDAKDSSRRAPSIKRNLSKMVDQEKLYTKNIEGLLYAECKRLLKLLTVTKEIDLKESIKHMKEKRADIVPGAGLLSQKTLLFLKEEEKEKQKEADRLRKEQEREERIKKSTQFLRPSPGILDSIDEIRHSLGNLPLQNKIPIPIQRKVESRDTVVKLDSLNGNMASIHSSNELNYYSYSTIFGDRKIESWTDRDSDKNINIHLIKNNSSSKSSIFRGTGKNILNMVNSEYEKLINKQQLGKAM